MGILKKYRPEKNQGSQFIGAYVKPQIDIMITLAAITERSSKSAILRQILEDWCQDTHRPTRAGFTSIIAEQAYHVWKAGAPPDHGGYGVGLILEYEHFTEDLKKELFGQGLPGDLIDEIMEKFDALCTKKR